MKKGDIPTTSEAYKHSLGIAIPAIIEMVSLALMAMIDTVMVGQLGAEAVSAVGLTTQPRMLFLSVFFAINIAVTAIIARNKGADNMAEARRCLRHALFIIAVLGTIGTIAAVIFARPLMTLAGAQPDTVELAASYFRITSYVLLLQVFTQTICVAQRACGYTKITMKVNVTAKIVSVALNFLLIEGRFGFPRLEVDGAAWSTAIAASVAFVLAFASILHKDSMLRISWRDDWGLELPMLKSIGRLASGGAIEQIGFRFGFFMYARIVAELGTDDFAAHMLAMQLMVLSFTFADGIGAATTALVGQNLGKGRADLSIMYGKIGMRMAIVAAATLSALCIIFRYQFPLLFIDDPNIVATTAGLILILAYILPVQTAQIVMGGSLRGAGDTKYVAMTMVGTVGVMRPLLAFLFTFPLGFGLTGAWVAMLFDQVGRLIFLFVRFAGGKWIKAKV